MEGGGRVVVVKGCSKGCFLQRHSNCGCWRVAVVVGRILLKLLESSLELLGLLLAFYRCCGCCCFVVVVVLFKNK